MSAGVVVAKGTGKVGDESSRYLIKSNNSILKMAYGVNHKFDSGFTTELSKGQIKLLNKLGVETEEVGVCTITVKPFCDKDGICNPELGEGPSCIDCKGEEEPPTEERTCFPTENKQVPWGITKVNGNSGGVGITIAVLDTGVYREHLDLDVKICKDATKRGIKNGCTDSNGHGTHVAGTIAANGGSDHNGIYGVAPEAELMAIKVCGPSGICWNDDIAAGIKYATDNNANIISMSLGGGYSLLIDEAVEYATDKGVLVIASAGNSGPDEDTIGYPAANPNVIAVAAFDSSDEIAEFSSRGSDSNVGNWTIEEREIEFAAPGVYIESTWKDGCYNTISGTSMAAPHITGIAARDWQGNASATRVYLQGLAKTYTENTVDGYDYGNDNDDIAAGFGLPIALQ